MVQDSRFTDGDAYSPFAELRIERPARVTYVETPMSVGEARGGLVPGAPVGPADRWPYDAAGEQAVGERDVEEPLDPAWLQPVLRDGIDCAGLRSARGAAYVMLRSPDDGDGACFLRLTPEEWELAQLMDGTHTVARLVAEFARIAGRLAPDEVRRVVADLAGNQMLEELPAGYLRTRPATRPVAGALRGRRIAVGGVDGIFAALHRAGGRFLFTRVAAVALSLAALAGFGVFAVTWWRGSESVFLAGGSYLLGAVVLLVFGAFAGACREIGRGLATKHAGRAVPTAGLLVRLGLPALRVDTSDVWMAGRRARMRVAATGPVTVLALAGVAQLVGLVVPPLAGPAFTLAFVCYLHALVHLSPLLPLDGYHLVMDWLEIPALRARALSWLGGWLRRRPRGFSTLDAEGRLIALYGILAAFWLAVTAGVAYRVWTDRLSGLVTGLWPDGAAARLLLVAVLVGLCAPLLRHAVGRAGAALRRYRARIAERRREADAPRRLAALRASELGGLPEPALASLAARARWLHPGAGRQIVVTGGSPAVYIVVEGALQGRRQGDPGGTVRHHVGPGGVVGLADALTGRPSALDWHTAGTTLLVLPTAAVATVIGPIPGPPPADRAEAEALFADTPALAGFADDERQALIAAAHPVDLEPGAPVMLPGPTHAVVVESGVIALPDGVELRRGTLVGPVGVGEPGMVAQARTPVRLWVMPDAASLPPLVGSARPGGAGLLLPAARQAPVTDDDPGAGYPPLAAPPGLPDDTDAGPDHRFERGMWWLVGSAVLAALLFTGTGLFAGPAWAEMPTDRVLLAADGDAVSTVVAGTTVRLGAGDERYLPVGARVEVGARSTGRMTFRGGGAVVLCAGTQGAVTGLESGGDRVPRATLVVDSGRLLADTTGTSGAFAPLALIISRTTGEVRNAGPARYAVEPSTVTVAAGNVQEAGAPVAPVGTTLGCGADVPDAPPVSDAPSESPTEEPSLELPSEEPSEPEPSVTESPTPEPEETATEEPTETPDRDDDPQPERTTLRPRPVTPPTRPQTTRPVPRPTTPTAKPTTIKPTTVKPTIPAPTVEPTIPVPTVEPTEPAVATGPVKPAPNAGAAMVTSSPAPEVRG